MHRGGPFAFELRAGIDALWRREILLGPGPRIRPDAAEDVIGADLHQRAIEFAARPGQVFDGDRIDRPAFLRLAFGPIDLRVGGAIDDGRGPQFAQSGGHGRTVAEIERVDVHGNSASPELPAQLAAQLPVCSGDEDFHGGYR